MFDLLRYLGFTCLLAVAILGGCAPAGMHAIAARGIVGGLATVVEARGLAPSASVEVLPAPPEHAKRIGYLRVYPGAKPCGEDVPEDVTREGERIGASFVVFAKGHFGTCKAEYFAASSP
jgi:hypothetical protein